MNIQLGTFILICAFYSLASAHKNSTLELVFGLFRHGKRTNVYFEPEDVSSQYTAGQLTNQGKHEEYFLGKKLHERYKHFLGKKYLPGLINAFTTNFDRTKDSLQLILAGLFPPKNSNQEWNSELNWQPIPYNQLADDDNLLAPPEKWCPKHVEVYRTYLESAEGKQIRKSYINLFPHLSDDFQLKVSALTNSVTYNKHPALKKGIQSPVTVYVTKEIEGIAKLAAKDYFATSTSTHQLQQLSGGFLLKKIINSTLEKIHHILEPPNLKMIIYSGHDFNLIYLLSALHIFHRDIYPLDGAYILIEIHKINGIHGVKIFYGRSAVGKLELFQVPGCTKFCPFDKFIQLVKNVLPPHDNFCDITGGGIILHSGLFNIILMLLILANSLYSFCI